jgi:hypothetical protein
VVTLIIWPCNNVLDLHESLGGELLIHAFQHPARFPDITVMIRTDLQLDPRN